MSDEIVAPKRVHSDYLTKPMDVEILPSIVDELATTITESGIDFKSIAFRGMSGALVSPMLAIKLRKEIIVCRKPSERAHGWAMEGYSLGGNFIIVDDFSSSGATVRNIIDVITHFPGTEEMGESQEGTWYGYGWEGKPVTPFIPVGIFLYLRKGSGVFDHRVFKNIPMIGIPSGEFELSHQRLRSWIPTTPETPETPENAATATMS